MQLQAYTDSNDAQWLMLYAMSITNYYRLQEPLLSPSTVADNYPNLNGFGRTRNISLSDE